MFTFYDDGTVKTQRSFDVKRHNSFNVIKDAHSYVIKTFVTDMRDATKCPFNPRNRSLKPEDK